MALFVLAAVPAAVPAGAQSVKTGGTVTVALDGEIDTIDPLKSVTIVGFQVYSQLYESLVTANARLDAVEPQLAESWDVSPDGLTYTFHLRPGVKFHNVKDFKA
jgi:peptide/nickel transport system substrate-binding protein